MARGISTVIGALLFIIVASMLLALILRAFGEVTLAFNEVSNNQRFSEERLNIQASYGEWRVRKASETLTSMIVTLGTAVTPLDPVRLDSLDGNTIVVRAAPSGGGGGGGAPVTREMIRNGAFDEGLNYWGTSGRRTWRVVNVRGDNMANYTDSLTGNDNQQAAIWQDFTLGFTPTVATLSFEYSSEIVNVHPPGQEKECSFTLIVSLARGGTIVWSQTIDLRASPSGTRQITLPSLQTGSYRLSFQLLMQTTARVNRATFRFLLDDVSLKASEQPPPSAPGAAYQLMVSFSFTPSGLNLRGFLVASANSSAFIEIYRWSESEYGGSWILVEKQLVSAGVRFKLSGFESSRAFLLVTYSTRGLELTLDYLKVEVYEMTPVKVAVVNTGTESVEIYAVWLRNTNLEVRQDARTILTPGSSLNVSFPVTPSPGGVYEVRVVTATRTHRVKFTAG